MARVTTSPETQTTAAVERFGFGAIGWLILFMAVSSAGFLAYVLHSRILLTSSAPGTAVASLLVFSTGSGLLILLFTVLAIPLLMAEIRVSADALIWRTWRGTFCSSWGDVLDFYETADSANAISYLIQTRQGDCRFVSTWNRVPLLKEIVAERAVNVRATEWGVIGARPDLDWPKTFDYNDGMNRWGIPMIRIICYSYMIWIVASMGPRAWRMASEPAAYSGWLLGSAVLMVSAAVYFSTPVLCLFVVPSFGELRRRRTQTITLSRDGIVYQDSTRTIEARWDEITRLFNTSLGPYNVETKHGTFDFRITMREGKAVFRAFKAMTAATLPDGWQSKTPERLDHPNGRASTVPSGQETHIFSYRTRTNRALGFLGLMFFGVQGGFALWKHPLGFHSLSLADLIVEVIMIMTFAGGLGFTLWGWLTFLTESVQTDEEGIMQTTCLGSKRIRWSEVTGMKIVGGDAFTWIVIFSARQKIWFSPLIADCKKLVKEIKSRVSEGCAFSAEEYERIGRLVGQD